jgi:2-dehydropantoate 2-reductase
MREVVAIAAAYGRPIRPAFVDKMLDDTEKMAPYKPSMLLDFERRQPLELDVIYRRPLDAARAAGVPCPEIEGLYAELCGLAESVGSLSLQP